MERTKVLSVVANSTERSDSPSFGLVKAIENAIEAFLKGEKGESKGYDLVGTQIDAGAGSVADAQAVFGRTLVVLRYEGSGKKKE